MIFRISNMLTDAVEDFQNREEAVVRAQEIKNEYMAQENYRFTANKEISLGEDVQWVPVNLNSETDELAQYQVFNTLTGLHEKITGATVAKNKQAQIKNEFATAYGLGLVFEVDETKEISPGGVE